MEEDPLSFSAGTDQLLTPITSAIMNAQDASEGTQTSLGIHRDDDSRTLTNILEHNPEG